EPRGGEPARVVGGCARDAAGGLERPARRDRARLLRLRRARGPVPLADQPAPRRHAQRVPLPLRAAGRLRRVAGNGGALPRAVRRDRRRRLGLRAARALRHPPRADAGSRLADLGSDRLMSEPMSWYMIEPGWAVVDSDGDEAGKVADVLGDTEADIFNG